MPFKSGNNFAAIRQAKKAQHRKNSSKGGKQRHSNWQKRQITAQHTTSFTPTLSSKQLRSRKICAGMPLSSTIMIDLENMQELNKYTNNMISNGWKCYHCNLNKIQTCDDYIKAAIVHVHVACANCNTMISVFRLGKIITNNKGC